MTNFLRLVTKVVGELMNKSCNQLSISGEMKSVNRYFNDLLHICIDYFYRVDNLSQKTTLAN